MYIGVSDIYEKLVEDLLREKGIPYIKRDSSAEMFFKEQAEDLIDWYADMKRLNENVTKELHDKYDKILEEAIIQEIDGAIDNDHLLYLTTETIEEGDNGEY